MLVADVAAPPAAAQPRRLPGAARALGLYLHDACVPSRLGLAVCGDGGGDEPDVVMADVVVAAANPELVGAFDHVAFVDPPFDGGLFGAHPRGGRSARPASPCLWGESEVDFTKAVVADTYDLEAACRAVYRALSRRAASSTSLLAGLLGARAPAAGLPRWLPPGARCARPVCWHDRDGKKGVNKAEGKVDLATSDTYRTMARTIPHDDYSSGHCLTSAL